MNRTDEQTVEALLVRIAALQAENHQPAERVIKLEEDLALARLHRFGPRSEKVRDRLLNEAEQIAGEDDAGAEDGEVGVPDTGLPKDEAAPCAKRGRKALPANLPRERVEYDLADEQKVCPCCRNRLHRMGETVTEQLHIEVKAKVLQNVRFKYACRHCDRTGINTPVVMAPMPRQPLPGSIATASTLAFALVHKYVDGTPLYRLALAFGRAGVPVSRGALGHWVIGASEKHLNRIYDALKLRLGSQPLIHGDETTVQVLKEKDREATSTSYMWAYRSGEDSADGRMPIDNNLLERDIRIFATGRKSWLFSDTVAGAKTSAVIYSLMLTCPPVASSRWPGCATSLPNYRNASQRPISLICCPSTSPKRSPQSETARPRPRSAQKRAATCQEMRAYGSSIPSPTNQRNMRLYCICSIGCRSERIEKRMCSRLALISRSGAIEGRPKSA
jgi:transposase